MCDTDASWPIEVVPRPDLVGREPLLDSILANIRAGRSVSLIAPRRVGKTSVALEALRRLQADEAIVAHIDFFRIESRREFADELIRQLVEHSHSLRERAKQVGRGLRRVVGALKPHLTVFESEFGLDFAKTSEDELFRRAIELPELLADREKRLCVVFMDEFQEADRSLGKNAYMVMRSYFQQQPHTKHIFAGSQETLLRALFTKPNAPLLRYAAELPFPDVPQADWRDYIVRKFREAHLSCSPGLAEQLLAQTGGHPADTMEVCQQLEFAVRAAGVSEANVDHLSVAMQVAAASLRGIYDEIWDHLGQTAGARQVAARLANGLPPRPPTMHTQAYSRAVKALIDKGVVRRAAGRSQFTFPEPLFRRYIAN